MWNRYFARRALWLIGITGKSSGTLKIQHIKILLIVSICHVQFFTIIMDHSITFCLTCSMFLTIYLESLIFFLSFIFLFNYFTVRCIFTILHRSILHWTFSLYPRQLRSFLTLAGCSFDRFGVEFIIRIFRIRLPSAHQTWLFNPNFFSLRNVLIFGLLHNFLSQEFLSFVLWSYSPFWFRIGLCIFCNNFDDKSFSLISLCSWSRLH